MFSYYSSVILMSWMALGVLSILVHENARIPDHDKRLLYLSYFLIAVSALAEWCGVQLSGRTELPVWMLKAAKCADYILTPLAGGVLIMQIHLRNRWQRVLCGILAFNTVLQLVSAPMGWMITIDRENHYAHGPFYPAYLLICLTIVVLMVIQFTLYGRYFRRQNHNSLLAIMLLVAAGIVIQELLPDGHRIAYLGLTMGAALMFIHNSEFKQLLTDDYLIEQQMQIDTDALTGVYSRMAFSDSIKRLDADQTPLPRDFAAFVIDINGLKRVNDQFGHDAGDDLIQGAAACIQKVFQDAGPCYRTGGDEFVVLVREMPPNLAREALGKLEEETSHWRGKKVPGLSLAAGCALARNHPGLSAKDLVREADFSMYAAKTAYYRKKGMNGRHTR